MQHSSYLILIPILGELNDLWRYRMNDSTWTWISGSDGANKKAVYGEKGQASVSYTPGGREGAVGWYDSSTQNFYLFGGCTSSFGSYSCSMLGHSTTLKVYKRTRLFQ